MRNTGENGSRRAAGTGKGTTVAERPKSRQTEAALKAAARRLLVTKGYAETKITDITTEAGKSAGSFYRYFPDKDSLLRSLAEDFEADLHAEVLARAGEEHKIESVEDVRQHVRAYWAAFEQRLPEMTGVLQASMVNEEFRRIHLELREREVELWARHLREARGETAVTEDGGRLAATALVCMLEYFCYNRLVENRQLADADTAIEALVLVMAGALLGALPD
jgi:AcrR family transcriptional regulator